MKSLMESSTMLRLTFTLFTQSHLPENELGKMEVAMRKKKKKMEWKMTETERFRLCPSKMENSISCELQVNIL